MRTADITRKRALGMVQLLAAYLIFQLLHHLNNALAFTLNGFDFDTFPLQVFAPKEQVRPWPDACRTRRRRRRRSATPIPPPRGGLRHALSSSLCATLPLAPAAATIGLTVEPELGWSRDASHVSFTT